MANCSTTVRTKKEKYLVSSVTKRNVWLEVLHGDDKGIRVSIPLYSKRQSDDIIDTIHSLQKGDVVSATLESPDKLPRDWTINSITKIH